MKKLLLMSLLASTMAMTSVNAEPLPSPVIGIIEQATLDKSAAFKSIIGQITKKRNEIEKEMSNYANSLKTKEDQLIAKQKKLSEKEFAAERDAFEKQVHEAEGKVEVRRAQMENGVEEAKKKVYEAFLKAADEVRKEAGANIIVYKETIVTADNVFDLTPKVLEKLNKTLPSVQVQFKSEAEVKKQLSAQPQ